MWQNDIIFATAAVDALRKLGFCFVLFLMFLVWDI